MADPSDADLMASFQQQEQGAGQAMTTPAPGGLSMPYDADHEIVRGPDGTIQSLRSPITITLADGTTTRGSSSDPGLIANFLKAHPEDIANKPAPQQEPTDADLTASLIKQVPGAVAAPQQPAAMNSPGQGGAFSSPGAFMRSESNGFRDLLNGATFGGVDRLNSAIAALPKLPQGLGAVQDAFSQEMDRQRQLDGDHPGIAHTVNSFAGGLIPAALMPQVEAPTLLGRAAIGAGQGALLGAADGIGNARGNLPDMLRAGLPTAAAGAAIGGPLGAAFGASPLAAKLPKLATMEDYARTGVDPSLAINGSGGVQRIAQTIKGLPFVGQPIATAAARSAGQINSGIQGVAKKLGPAVDPYEGGGALVSGAEGAVEAMKAKANELYRPINRLEEKSSPIPVSNAQHAIGEIFDRYSTPSMQDWFARKAPELVRMRDTLANAGVLSRWGIGRLKFGELRAMRTDVGKMLDDKVILGTIDQANLKRLYGALTQDLHAGAEEIGGQGAKAALQHADAYNAAMHARVEDTLSTVLKANSKEQAFDRVKSMAKSNSRGDLDQLNRLARTLPAEAKQNFAASFIQSLGRDAEGTFSYAKFATEWSKLSPAGKRAVIGSDKTVEDLDALYRVASQQKAADKFYNHSNSGHAAAGVLVADKLGEYVMEGHAANVEHMLFHDIPAIAALYSAAYGVSHALASPGFARLVMRASKAATPGAQKQVERALLDYANDNQPIRREVLNYQQELARRFKANAPVATGVDAQSRGRQAATGR